MLGGHPARFVFILCCLNNDLAQKYKRTTNITAPHKYFFYKNVVHKNHTRLKFAKF